MAAWLIDTALLKDIGSPKAPRLEKWLDDNDASIFLSAVSLSAIALSIKKMPVSQPKQVDAQKRWFSKLTTRYADRIHPVDSEVAMRAGMLLPGVRNGPPRHHFHDALLLATAQIHGHGLLTRREAVFGEWTNVPVVVF